MHPGPTAMPRRPRRILKPICFHVTNRRAGRTAIFQTPADYRAFLEILHQGLQRHPVRLIAYCLMPNHWHLVVGPVYSDDLSRLMHWVTVTHAVRWHHHRNSVGLGPVYQNRYWSEPLDDPDRLILVCRYVERNALKAHLVSRAEDWPWCSLADRLRPSPSLPVVSSAFLTSRAWTEYVNAPSFHEEAPWRVFHKSRPVPLTVENVPVRGPGRQARRPRRSRAGG